MQNTAIIQGTFVSTGNPVTIAIPMGIDWMRVYDYTNWGAEGDSYSTPQSVADIQIAIEWYYQRGMAPGTGIMIWPTNSATTLNNDTLQAGGFTYIQNPLIYGNSNDVVQDVGPGFTSGATAFTLTAATPPVLTVTTGTTLFNNLNGLSILRMASIPTAPLLSGIDYSFGALALSAGTTTAKLINLTTTSAITGGTKVTVFGIPYNPYWYPSTRTICNIAVNSSNGAYTDITTTVTANVALGQTVRILVPQNTPYGTSWGMPQINEMYGNVVGISALSFTGANTITVDINSSAFTAFNKPGSAGMPLTTAGVQWPTLVPIGDVSMQIVDVNGNNIPTNSFLDATFNQGFVGMTLGQYGLGTFADTTLFEGPCGEIGSTMYWVAGKSFSNTIGLNTQPAPLPPLGY